MKPIIVVAALFISGCAQLENVRTAYCSAVSEAERAQLRASFQERTGQKLEIDCEK